ncbi:MAG: hypothetical protein F6J86_46860 [Symploca sp. SIO1B1]|nr:hypothetical protein [Symploca sp. SIO1B1]
MTDAELGQLIESNARTAQANSEGIQELKTSIIELRISTENLRSLIDQQKAMDRALESRLQLWEGRKNGTPS